MNNASPISQGHYPKFFRIGYSSRLRPAHAASVQKPASSAAACPRHAAAQCPPAPAPAQTPQTSGRAKTTDAAIILDMFFTVKSNTFGVYSCI